MSANAQRPEARAWESGPIPYQVICLASLVVMYLVEAQRGPQALNLIVPLVGLLGVLSKGSAAPVLLLFALTLSHLLGPVLTSRDFLEPGFLSGRRGGQGGPLHLGDLVLAMAVLAYVAAHYRLQGLTQHILPPDPRRRLPERGFLGRILLQPQPRAAHLASPVEVGLFLLAIPVWALVAQVIWLTLDRPWDPAGWPPWANRLVLLAWLVGIGLILAKAAFGLWKRWQHDPHEAATFLQDVLWHETRREQRRAARWLALGRLKRSGENP
jgi:hypothetical protein